MVISSNEETSAEYWNRAYNQALKDCIAGIRKMDTYQTMYHMSDKTTWYWDGALDHVIKTIKKLKRK